MNGNEFGMALISAPSDKAEGIARTIVERKLAACAQITAEVTSLDWWKGELESGRERLLFLKTERSFLSGIQELLKEIHPYEVPELIFLPISGGNLEYLAWISKSLKA
jgi:periplasmic divalent cation tolerance protein